MEEGLLSLKWNNHKSTFFQILSLLREKHTYTDVTLACDGRLYPVHKFVLSTCSEYFSDIFNSNNGNNIVIVLKDVRRQDLEYLLDYMYLGQVDVAQSELSSLIKTAECLKIKGLAIPDDEPEKLSRRVAEDRDQVTSPPSKKKRHHADESKHTGVGVSTSRITPILSSIPSPSLPTPMVQQQQALLQRLQVPVSQQQILPTSQAGSKSHLGSPLTNIISPRSLQVVTTLSHSSSNVPPLSSPTQPSVMQAIKQEITDPMDTGTTDYGHENFEETKPDISDALEQDLAVAGPSGLQGSADNWDGESDLGGYSGSETYPEGGMDEGGDSEAQGGSRTQKSPFGYGEAFLRHLEDKSGPPKIQLPPCSQIEAPNSCNASVVQSSTRQQSRVHSDRPMFPTSGGSIIRCADNGSTLESPLFRSGHTLQDMATSSLSDASNSFHSPFPQCRTETLERILAKRLFKCPYCNITVKGKKVIEDHVIMHSLGGYYLCPFCVMKCRSAPGLSSHLKIHEQQGDY